MQKLKYVIRSQFMDFTHAEINLNHTVMAKESYIERPIFTTGTSMDVLAAMMIGDHSTDSGAIMYFKRESPLSLNREK